MTILDQVHDIAEKLTGDRWVPYSSALFCQVIVIADTHDQLELIKERRTFNFTRFMGGDPQREKLEQLLKKYQEHLVK